MERKSPKESLLERVNKLPDDATMHEAMAELILLYRVEQAQKNSGEDSISQKELEAKYRKKKEKGRRGEE